MPLNVCSSHQCRSNQLVYVLVWWFIGLYIYVNVDEFLDERFKMVFVGICCTIHKCTYMYTVLISVYVFKLTCLCACLVVVLCVCTVCV